MTRPLLCKCMLCLYHTLTNKHLHTLITRDIIIDPNTYYLSFYKQHPQCLHKNFKFQKLQLKIQINQMQEKTLSMMESQKKFSFGKTFVFYNPMIDDRQLEHLETRLVYQRKKILLRSQLTFFVTQFYSLQACDLYYFL